MPKFTCPDCQGHGSWMAGGADPSDWGRDLCGSCDGRGELEFGECDYESAMEAKVGIKWETLIAWIMDGNGNDYASAQQLAADYGYTRQRAKEAAI